MIATPRNEQRAAWRLAALIAVASAALLAVGTLAGMNVDEDEFGTSVLMTTLQAQAAWHGHLPFWSSRLAFGLPLPGAQSFFLHPLMTLFAWMDPYSALMGLYAVHIVAGALGLWWLCRTMMLSPVTTGVCTATFLLSSPSLQYTMTACYPSYFVAWTVAPVVAGLLLRVLIDDRPDARVTIALGLAAGLMLADGHLGHAPFLLGTIAMGALGYARRLRERASWLALAAVVAIAIGSAHVGTTFDEYLRFPSGLPRWDNETLTAGSTWDIFLRPLTPEFVRRVFDGRPEHAGEFLLWRGTHVISFGGPFALLAIAGAVSPRHRHAARPLFASAGGAAIVLMAISSRWPLFGSSAPYLLRDTVVIGGIGLAGITLDRLRAAGNRRRAFGAIVAAQLIVIAASAAPFVTRSLAIGRSFRANGSDAVLRAVAERLTSPARRDAGRVYFAAPPGLWAAWGVERPLLWSTRMIAGGVRVINGSNKGIAMEPLMPSYVLPYGSVDSNPSFSRSMASLTVLGVRSIVALEAEPVADRLELLDSWLTPTGRLRLLDNPHAWPGAHFVASEAFDRELPLLPSCPHQRLLCRDLGPVLAAADEDVGAVRYGDDAIIVTFLPASRPRTLLVTEMFRDGWFARVDGARRPVTPAWGALMRVDVPAGASSAELRYRPSSRIALTAFSWCAALFAFVFSCFRREFVLQRSDRSSGD